MRVVDEILQELARNQASHDAFHSAHEGFSVLDEERDELWDEVKKKLKNYDYNKMRLEAVQIAANAIRFVLDICDSQES